MKVLFLASDISYPPRGGRSLRTYNILRQAASCAEVHFVAFDQGYGVMSAEERSASISHLEDLCETVDIVPMPFGKSRVARAFQAAKSLLTGKPYSRVIYESPAMRECLQRIDRSVNLDLFHCDGTDYGFYRDIIRAPAAVLTHHNVESFLMQRRAQIESGPTAAFVRLEAWKLERYERWLCERYNIHIAVSLADSQQLSRRIDPQRLRVVPNGVDTQFFRPGIASEGCEIVHVGGLNWFPNRDGIQHFLRHVWPRVLEKHASATFTLIGGGIPKELRERATKDTSIKVLGMVDDIRPHVEQAQVFVVPLRLGSGTRLKILDAMAMGKAIVSTSIGCAGIDIHDGQELLIADDPGTFAAAIDRLLTDAEIRSALGQRARQAAEQKFDWQMIGTQLRIAYRDAS